MGLGRSGRGGGVIILAGSGGSGIVAPVISYAGSPFNLEVGVAMTPASPTNTGGASTSWAEVGGPVLPGLGLALNATTGEITGTPTVEVENQAVTIRATNGGGAGDTTIYFGILSLALFTAGPYGYYDGNI